METATPQRSKPLSRIRARALLDRLAIVEARQDSVFFCNTFCWGQDFEAKPFPKPFKTTLYPWQESYIRRLTDHGDEQLKLILLKGRKTGATWATIWFVTWAVWARPLTQALLLSDTERKAEALLARHKFCVNRLPAELEYPVPDLRTGTENLTTRIFPNGSEIHSLPGDPDSIRSYHATIVALDEAAKFKKDPRAALIGIDSDIIIMSTADGIGNPFEEIWTDADEKGGAVWGYEPRFVSWRERPNLRERPKGSPQLVAQEHPDTPQEAFQASSANLHTLDDDQLVERFEVPKAWPVVLGVDPGIATGAWIWIARVCGSQGPMRDGDLLIVDEFDAAEMTVAKQMAQDRKRRGRLRVVHSVIDPSAYSRSHTGESHIKLAELFSDRGLQFVPGSNDRRAAILALQELLEERHLWVMSHLGGVIGDIRSVTLANMDKKHFYAALRYAVLEKPESWTPTRRKKKVDLAAEQIREMMARTERYEERGPVMIHSTEPK